MDVGRERRDVTLADLVVAKIHVGEFREVVDSPVLGKGTVVMASDGGMGAQKPLAATKRRCRPRSRDSVGRSAPDKLSS